MRRTSARSGAVGQQVTMLLVAGLLGLSLAPVEALPAHAGPAGTEHRPDLQTIVPTDSFSEVAGADGPEFRYTHLIYNAGPGPLEIQPAYDDATGGYRGRQLLFSHDAAGAWSEVREVRVPDTFVYHAEHGHFHFPLASFGLYSVASDGGLGAPVVMSPKIGFCIDDSYIYNDTVPHAGTFIGTRSSCADPNGLRGISVGGADEYDYRDPGQAIPMTGVPDGTYWFRAMTDPNNDFIEANESNNETDVRVTINKGTVTAGEVRHPDTTPPTGAMSRPADGATVTGSVPVTVTAATGVRRAELVVDGNAVSTASATTSPFGFSWNSTSVVDGEHWLSARITDANGRVGSTGVTAVSVDNTSTGPPSGNGPTIAATAFADGRDTRTATMTGLHGGELVLAFVAADGPASSAQTATVSGGGVTWRRVRRVNTQAGTSEVWRAMVPAGRTSLTATSALSASGFDQSLHLMAFTGAAGVGASAGSHAASGAPQTRLTSTQAGSWTFGVGNDWDQAIARTLGTDQTLRHQWLDSGVGDTFWMQSRSAPTAAAGTVVVLNDTAPTTDRWNLAAVEVLGPAAPTTPDQTAPTVSVTEPTAGSTVSGTVNLAATAADNVGVSSVTFKVDGQQVGSPDTTPPFSIPWATTGASSGAHTVTAQAVDAAGNVGVSDPVTIQVDNSHPPAAITIDAKVVRQGRDTLTSPGLTTGGSGETVLAFLAMDGPGGDTQSATVSGGGLNWSLVKRANTQSGDAEIWSAVAPTRLSNAVITATPARTGYDGALTVVAYGSANRTGVAGAAGGPTGTPSIYLPAVTAGSWVFAVGNDWDHAQARTPVAGQLLQQQWVDTDVGDTFWVQSTAAPSQQAGLVTIADSSPTNDQWNYAAVEVVAQRG